MKQIITKDKRVVCVTTPFDSTHLGIADRQFEHIATRTTTSTSFGDVRYPAAVVKEMKKAGYKVTEVSE